MTELSDAISQLSNGEYNQFKTTVSDILMDRLKGRIDNEKYSVAQQVFNDEQQDELEEPIVDELDEPEQTEETSDEEV